MRPPPSLRKRPATLAVLVSLGLHLALLGALALLPSIDPLQQEPDQGIEVELVTPEQIAPPVPTQTAEPAPLPAGGAPPAASAAAAPAPASPPPAVPPAAPPVAPPAIPPAVPTAPVRVRARRLLAGEVLSNPRSRGTRDALAQMDEAERIEQLCNLEAMGQIHAWKAEFEPDRVVASAMGGTKLLKTVMQADDAAFRSKRQWYRLQFRCELTPDRKMIGGFEFAVGDPVPRGQWRALDLPEVH